MIKRFTYNDYHIDLVYQFLKGFKKQKTNKEYEIRIDGLTVVERTEDLNHFYWFKKYVDELMTRVSFVFYKGKSRKSDQYILERMVQEKEVLDQTAIDKAVQNQTETFEKEMKFKLLKKKNKQLKQQLNDALNQNKVLASKQDDGMSKIMTTIGSLFNGTSINNSDSSNTKGLPQEIGGVPLNQLLDFIKAKQKKWGDAVLGRSIGVAMIIGDDTVLLEKIEHLIKSNTQTDEEE